MLPGFSERRKRFLVEKKEDINLLVMLTVRLALEAFVPEVSNSKMTFFSDNTTVITYVNQQGGTHSRKLYHPTWELLMQCSEWSVVPQASHIAGREKVMADAPSRGNLDTDEWSLSQGTFKAVFKRTIN